MTVDADLVFEDKTKFEIKAENVANNPSAVTHQTAITDVMKEEMLVGCSQVAM